MKNLLILITFLITTSAWATSINGWDIQLAEPSKVTPAFHTQEEVETYTGDFMLVNVEQQPKDGYIYVVYHLVIAPNTGKGSAPAVSFDPEKITLDIKGQNFSRVADDDFLYDYKMTPMTHLKMKLGTHKGTIVFEIPEQLKNEKMTLKYNTKPITEK